MRLLLLTFLVLPLAYSQSATPKNTQSPPESAELKAARHSFMLVSTRAIALFQSADTIEARLEADGSTLRPSTTALRLRIERTLDQAEASLNKADATRAKEHIKVADELVNRFERRIGGE
jgi:ElaB/YqjD/DUF883 family membrane-anchored ribosome-binding protein